MREEGTRSKAAKDADRRLHLCSYSTTHYYSTIQSLRGYLLSISVYLQCAPHADDSNGDDSDGDGDDDGDSGMMGGRCGRVCARGRMREERGMEANVILHTAQPALSDSASAASGAEVTMRTTTGVTPTHRTHGTHTSLHIHEHIYARKSGECACTHLPHPSSHRSRHLSLIPLIHVVMTTRYMQSHGE